MPAISKTIVNLIADAVVTIGFFYLAMRVTPYAVGFTGAGIVYAFSIIPGLGLNPGPADPPFLDTAMLYSLAAVYMLLPFALGVEVLRRVMRMKPLLLYVAGAVVMMAVYMHPEGTGATSMPSKAFVAGALLLAGAVGGAVYWLVTIKLRAALLLLLQHLFCSAGPHKNSCALS